MRESGPLTRITVGVGDASVIVVASVGTAACVASVSHCGCVNYKDSFDAETGIQMEFVVPNILRTGDIDDFITLIEPNALLISGTTQDKYSHGARRIYQHARPAFRKGTLAIKMYDANHVFTGPMREYAYRFLTKHLGTGFVHGNRKWPRITRITRRD